MKKFLILLLILTVVLAIRQHQDHDVLMADTSLGHAVQELEKTRLGRLFFEFAELNMMSNGAIDMLIDGVKSFGRQIEERLEKENQEFDALVGEHNSKVIALQSQINQAGLDINREKKRLNQELIPRKVELDDILIGLKGKKESNKDAVQTNSAIRDNQHQSFVITTNELTEAMRGIDEALELIDEMEQSGTVKASFIEVTNEQKKKVSKVLKQIKINTEKFGHQFSTFIQAITQLSESQNFKDRQVFKQMKDLLNSLRGSLQEALQKAYDDEAQQKENHNNRLTQLELEKNVFDQQYAESYQEREDKGVRIQDTQIFITTREEDLKGYEDRLVIENNNFASNQKIHDDVEASINEELSVLEKVLDLVQSPPFEDFLAGKMRKQL